MCQDKWKCRSLSAQLTSPDAQNSHSPLLSKPEAEIKRSLVTRISPSPRLLPGPDASGRSGGASVALAGRELLAVQDYAVVVERADCFHSCGQINREIIKQRTHDKLNSGETPPNQRDQSPSTTNMRCTALNNHFPPRKNPSKPSTKGQKPHRRGATRTPIPRDGSRQSPIAGRRSPTRIAQTRPQTFPWAQSNPPLTSTRRRRPPSRRRPPPVSLAAVTLPSRSR